LSCLADVQTGARRLLPPAKPGPANLTSSTAGAISVRTAIMRFAPPRAHPKRVRHTRVHEGVAVRLAGSLIRACHHGISFALLDEVKESFTGKLLFDGLCLTGLISRACAGNQSAKSHSNSEGFHWPPISRKGHWSMDLPSVRLLQIPSPLTRLAGLAVKGDSSLPIRPCSNGSAVSSLAPWACRLFSYHVRRRRTRCKGLRLRLACRSLDRQP
jgi:hypothetical protein